MKAIEILKQGRNLILKSIFDLTEEQLLHIPKNYKTNILWNIGHIVVVQQLLHYKLSGEKMYISSELCSLFSRGSSPSEWNSTPDIAIIKSQLIELPENLDKDYNSNKFKKFRKYTTSAGITLSDIEESLCFNNFHEGLHLGIIMSIKKYIA
ncbi:MAG: DinB family protein [Candidatus Anammoxibacter sp.]